MKKVYSWVSLLILVPLAACSYFTGGTPPQVVPPASTATLSPAQVQTQINQLLTTLPSSTAPAEQSATATIELPTLAVASETPSAPAAAPTATATMLTAVTSTPAVTPATTTAATAAATAETEGAGGGIGPTATLAAATATQAPATATIAPSAGPTQSTGPTFTPVPGDPRSRLGTPTSTDPMDNATKWVWPTGFDQYTSANFSGGTQSITALTKTDGWRLANPTGQEFTNVYIETTFRTQTCSANDHYGILARSPVLTQPTQGYLFTFTCDGRFAIRRWDAEVSPKGEMKRLVDYGKPNAAIDAGSNKINRMGVMLVGNRLMLYANGKMLADISDATFPYGYFGITLGSQDTPNFTIQVDEMSYWLNPQP